LWISFSLRIAYAISSSHVFQNEKSLRRRKGSNLVKARCWISLKKNLVTQRVKGHRLGPQREKGRLLNTAGAGADPVARVFLRGIVVEHCPRVLLRIEMPVKVDAISLVHRAGPVLALAHLHIVQGAPSKSPDRMEMD
jgi:hypothetical protein